MKIWQFYFAFKLYFYARGYLQFDGFLNFVLFLYWLLPVWAELYRVPRHPLFNRLHGPFGALGCVALLWHDTYFPPVSAVYGFLMDPSTRPSAMYVSQFLAGYWSWMEVGVISFLLMAFYALHRYRVSATIPPFIATLVPPAISIATKPPPLNQVEKDFYASQADKDEIIKLKVEQQSGSNFDIVILQVCSMAWEDLELAGLLNHPFLKAFDLVFTRFNTVTSYSTPAALRLLRAPCGQVQHSLLYQDANSDCYLSEQLKSQGYRFDVLFNHYGTSSETMGNDLQRLARAPQPISVQSIKPEAVNYDDSAILNNLETLQFWLNHRNQNQSPRTALYYNTVSLHGGSHFKNNQTWWKQDHVTHYHEAALRLFEDLRAFMALLQSSKRNVLVLMVAEHGAALKGNSVQAQDLRDIPLPTLTTVPLGVRWIVPGQESTVNPMIVKKAVSYRVLPKLIQFVANESRLPTTQELEKSLPTLTYFGENERAVTTIQDGRLYFKQRGGPWKSLPQTLIPAQEDDPVKAGVTWKNKKESSL
jgi:cellulose synthase operon protein YhjU